MRLACRQLTYIVSLDDPSHVPVLFYWQYFGLQFALLYARAPNVAKMHCVMKLIIHCLTTNLVVL
jgi:hypothetical protein